MLSVLIEGTLTAAPGAPHQPKGSAFVTASVRCPTDDGESILCSVIAFSASAAEALADLAAGDAVAITGPAALSRWEKDGEQRVGLKVTATRVLTVYEAGMRRKAASPDRQAPADRQPAPPARTDRNRPSERPATDRRPQRIDDMEDDQPI